MAIQRQMNFLGQMRLDVPHMRMLESAVAADFDVLAGKAMAGGQACILRGFDIQTTAAVGFPATSLQLRVADGVMIHPLASEAGSVFTMADNAAVETLNTLNSKTYGSFVASRTNYIGLDLTRLPDATTADVVMFLNTVTLVETPRTVPLSRSLSLRIVIDIQPFSSKPNVCPIAKVVLDSNSNVVSIEDARQMMFRLGSGGDNVDTQHSFPWGSGRAEVHWIIQGMDGQHHDQAVGAWWRRALVRRVVRP
jgi:hypothetical protein